MGWGGCDNVPINYNTHVHYKTTVNIYIIHINLHINIHINIHIYIFHTCDNSTLPEI